MTDQSKVTVRAQIWFCDMAVESHEAAVDALNMALDNMRHDCKDKFQEALESIGAKDVKVDLQVIG